MTANKSLRDPPGRARRRVGPGRARRADPRRALQRRAARTARSHPRRRRSHHRQPSVGPRRRTAHRRERPGPARGVPRRRTGDQGRSWITPASEWLVDNYPIVGRAAPRDPRRPAAGLLPRAAEAGQRPSRGLPAGPRHRLGLHRPHGQPVRPESLRRMIRAYQEVEPLTIGELWAIAISLRILLVDNLRRLCRADRPGPRRPTAGGRARGRAPRDHPGHRSGGVDAPPVANHPASGRPRPALPAPARPGPRGHAGPALARGPPRQAGDDRRGDGPPGASAPGIDERDGPQRDHEHALHLVVRLGRSSSRA